MGGRHILETAAEGGLVCLRKKQWASDGRALWGRAGQGVRAGRTAPRLVVVGHGVWHYCVNRSEEPSLCVLACRVKSV